MSLLLPSGLVNAWELVGTLPALVGTMYGRLLVLKLSLLLPLLAIAALNLLVFLSVPYSLSRLAQLCDLYAQVRLLGTEILAIPRSSDEASQAATRRLGLPFPVVTDGAIEASVAYTLFRSSLSSGNPPDAPLIPPHIEFLIDRQGYMRGRLTPTKGWAKSEQLLGALKQLHQEKLAAPPADLHVH
jgi:copper resistance protein D